MANNLIQIRRSNTSSSPTTTLNSGELAFSYASNAMFIGAQTGIGTVGTKIAGSKYIYLDNVGVAGTLANTATMVTDNNQFISNVYTSGLFIASSVTGPVANSTAALITSISPQANTSQLGASASGSNTELATTAAIVTYVSGRTSTIFSNAASYTWSATQAFLANLSINTNGNTQFGIGNTTVYTVVNATSFSGTANNALYLGGTLASGYQTTAGLAANVATLTSNNSTNFGGISLATLQAQITGNAASAYANAVANAAAIYQTTAGLSGNVATLTANNANYLGGVAAANYVNTTGSYTLGGVFTFNANVDLAATTTFGSGTGNATINSTSYTNYANATTYTQTTDFAFSAIDTATSTSTVVNTTAIAIASGTIHVGNTTANAYVNTSAFFLGNSTATNIITLTGDVVSVYAGGTTNTTATSTSNTTGNYITTLNQINATANVTSTSYSVTSTTLSLSSNVLVGNVSTVANNFTVNTSALSVGNTTVNASLTTTAVTSPVGNFATGANIAGQVTINSTAVAFGTIGSINATSANLSVSNMVISGNLTVSGSMTSIDVTTLQVKDNFVKLSDGNINVASDAVDFGVYGQANSGGVATYYGIGRVATANAFALFATTTDIGSTTIGADVIMPLQAYLQPWGNSGAFVVNSSAITVTANTTVAVNITANTLSLSTALPATSGGTGQGTYATGDILYASATNTLSRLSASTNGYILQMAAGVPTWNTLDGGTF